jgi:hypothetical protein
MRSAPKIPPPTPVAAAPRAPSMPTQASFITRGTASGQRSRAGVRPINPVVGASRSNVGAPSLLGGM